MLFSLRRLGRRARACLLTVRGQRSCDTGRLTADGNLLSLVRSAGSSARGYSCGLTMLCKLITLLGILSAATCCLHAGAVPMGSAHTRDFWREIAKNHYAVPAGQPIFPLMRELSGYLGS